MKLDQKAFSKMLERMGVRNEPLNAVRVIIELPDKTLVFESPQVTRTFVQNMEFFTVMGKYTEQAKVQQNQTVEIREEDVRLVAEQTGKSEAEAREALIKAEGDVAKAILMLTEGQGS